MIRQFLIKIDARSVADIVAVAGTEILVSFWGGMDELPEAAIRHPGTRHYSPPMPMEELVTWKDDDDETRGVDPESRHR